MLRPNMFIYVLLSLITTTANSWGSPHAWVPVHLELPAIARPNKSNIRIIHEQPDTSEFARADFFALCQLESSPVIKILQERAGDVSCDALANLYTNIKELDLAGLHLQSLDGLETFQQIESLDISSNEISSLEVIRGLRTLHSLNASDNRISDLAPLQNLHKLQSLKLARNRIRSLTALRTLESLRSLNLNENFISDCQPVARLMDLESLHLAMNAIRDVPNFSENPLLQRADFSSNLIRVIPKELTARSKAKKFDFTNNPGSKLKFSANSRASLLDSPTRSNN